MISPLCSYEQGLGVIWPPKKVRSGGLFLLTSFHFLLLFVTFFITCNFCKLLFYCSRFIVYYFLLLFFTACNFHKLLFTVEKGQGNCFIIFIHCSGGRGVP